MSTRYAPNVIVSNVIIDNLPPTGLHPLNTIVVTLKGQGSSKIPPQDIQRELLRFSDQLTDYDIKACYRLELPFKVYFTLSRANICKELHGVYFQLRNGVECYVCDVTKETRKLQLQWVPGSFTETHVRQLVTNFATNIVSIKRNDQYRMDIWTIYCEADDDTTPHFVNVSGSGYRKKSHEIFVSLQGRDTPCKHCGEETHWFTKCPEKHTRKTAWHFDGRYDNFDEVDGTEEGGPTTIQRPWATMTTHQQPTAPTAADPSTSLTPVAPLRRQQSEDRARESSGHDIPKGINERNRGKTTVTPKTTPRTKRQLDNQQDEPTKKTNNTKSPPRVNLMGEFQSPGPSNMFHNPSYHEDSEEDTIPDTLNIQDTQEMIQPTQDIFDPTPYHNDNDNDNGKQT